MLLLVKQWVCYLKILYGILLITGLITRRNSCVLQFDYQVFVNVVHVGVGPISHSDVDLAKACGACIVGFNIKSPPSSLSLAATQAGIKVLTCCSISQCSDENVKVI